jgi:hypothetical protein
MRIRFPHNSGNLLQQAIAVALLLGLLLGIGGVPVVTVTKKDRSRPYPCQDHACGCASADECWHHCCCFSNKEKVAWAEEHGVTPPDFVIAAAEREAADALVADGHEADEHAGCQDTHGTCACCAKRAGHAEEPACCRKRHQHHDVVAAAENDGPNGKSDAKVKFVLSDLARRCGGMQSVISFLCDALPFVDRPQWKPVETLVEYLVDVPVACASAELAPPVPPPKLARGLAA